MALGVIRRAPEGEALAAAMIGDCITIQNPRRHGRRHLKLYRDESRAVLAGLAECLAGLPLAVLASAGKAGRLAELYLRAELLTAEEPAERFERLRRRIEGEESSR